MIRAGLALVIFAGLALVIRSVRTRTGSRCSPSQRLEGSYFVATPVVVALRWLGQSVDRSSGPRGSYAGLDYRVMGRPGGRFVPGPSMKVLCPSPVAPR